MKANTGQYNESKNLEEALEKHFVEDRIKRDKASLTAFFLGGHTALQLAYDTFAKDIRQAKGSTQKSRLAAAEELLVYLENKSKGLKDSVQEE